MKSALNLPNQITFARLVLAVFFFLLLAQYSHREPRSWMLDAAWIIFVVAAITDYIDGYIARSRKLETPLGRVLDPVVDKVLVCGAFIFFVGPNFVDGAGRNATLVDAWMVVVIIGREILVTGLRGFNESQGKAFGASLHGKLKMWMQCIAVPIVLFLVAHEGTLVDLEFSNYVKSICIWMTVIVTALSAGQYLARSRHLLYDSAPA